MCNLNHVKERYKKKIMLLGHVYWYEHLVCPNITQFLRLPLYRKINEAFQHGSLGREITEFLVHPVIIFTHWHYCSLHLVVGNFGQKILLLQFHRMRKSRLQPRRGDAQFCSIPFNSLQFFSIPFNSLQFCSIPFNSFQFFQHFGLRSGAALSISLHRFQILIL